MCSPDVDQSFWERRAGTDRFDASHHHILVWVSSIEAWCYSDANLAARHHGPWASLRRPGSPRRPTLSAATLWKRDHPTPSKLATLSMSWSPHHEVAVHASLGASVEQRTAGRAGCPVLYKGTGDRRAGSIHQARIRPAAARRGAEEGLAYSTSASGIGPSKMKPSISCEPWPKASPIEPSYTSDARRPSKPPLPSSRACI